MNINGHVPFIINTLDITYCDGGNMLSKSVVSRSRLPDEGGGESQHSRYTTDPP